MPRFALDDHKVTIDGTVHVLRAFHHELSDIWNEDQACNASPKRKTVTSLQMPQNKPEMICVYICIHICVYVMMIVCNCMYVASSHDSWATQAANEELPRFQARRHLPRPAEIFAKAFSKAPAMRREAEPLAFHSLFGLFFFSLFFLRSPSAPPPLRLPFRRSLTSASHLHTLNDFKTSLRL